MNDCHRNCANDRTIILPLPAGEGRGEGEPFERECRAVHGKTELSAGGWYRRTIASVQGFNARKAFAEFLQGFQFAASQEVGIASNVLDIFPIVASC